MPVPQPNKTMIRGVVVISRQLRNLGNSWVEPEEIDANTATVCADLGAGKSIKCSLRLEGKTIDNLSMENIDNLIQLLTDARDHFSNVHTVI
jgi:hypothetical protein